MPHTPRPSALSTAGEQAILRALGIVHAATTDQLARMALPAHPSAQRLARRHLRRLRAAGLVRRFPDRSRDRRVGAPGHVHALTAAGLRKTSGSHPTGWRQRRGWRPTAAFLAHRLAISELYARLVVAQAGGGPIIRRFLAEPDGWRHYLGPAGKPVVLRPDAFAQLTIGTHENSWFIEVDRGTERPAVIAAKCQAYHHYELTGQEQRRSGLFPGVAFIVPDTRRAAVIRRVIEQQPPSLRDLFLVATQDTAARALARLEVVP